MKRDEKKRSAVGRWSLPIIMLMAGVIGGFLLCTMDGAQAHNKQFQKGTVCHNEQGVLHGHPGGDYSVQVNCEREGNTYTLHVPAENQNDSDLEQRIIDLFKPLLLKPCVNEADNYVREREHGDTYKGEALAARQLIDCHYL